MAEFTNPTNGITRTEDYRFTVTDLRDFELQQLKKAAKTHNERVRAAARSGEAVVKSWSNMNDYSVPKVSLMRVHIMPRGPRAVAAKLDYPAHKTACAYQSYLPQRHATHFDVYFREDIYNNDILRQEIETGLTSAQQRKVAQARYEVMLAEMEAAKKLREAGIVTVHTPNGKEYTTVEQQIADLRAVGVSEETIERMV